MLREGTSRQLHAWLADGLLERRNLSAHVPGSRLEWIPLPSQLLKLALPTSTG